MSKVVAVRCEEARAWDRVSVACAGPASGAGSAPEPPSASMVAPLGGPLSALESKGSKPAARSARGRSAEGWRARRAGLGRCMQ